MQLCFILLSHQINHSLLKEHFSHILFLKKTITKNSYRFRAFVKLHRWDNICTRNEFRQEKKCISKGLGNVIKNVTYNELFIQYMRIAGVKRKISAKQKLMRTRGLVAPDQSRMMVRRFLVISYGLNSFHLTDKARKDLNEALPLLSVLP